MLKKTLDFVYDPLGFLSTVRGVSHLSVKSHCVGSAMAFPLRFIPPCRRRPCFRFLRSFRFALRMGSHWVQTFEKLELLAPSLAPRVRSFRGLSFFTRLAAWKAEFHRFVATPETAQDQQKSSVQGRRWRENVSFALPHRIEKHSQRVRDSRVQIVSP